MTKKIFKYLALPLKILLLFFLLLYRYIISPVIGPRCRFYPSCSEYAREAILKYGILKGSYLTVKRLLKCHPFGGSGFDPVP